MYIVYLFSPSTQCRIVRSLQDRITYINITNSFSLSFLPLKYGTLDSQPQVPVACGVVHGRLFSPSTPASSITKTGHHDIAEILQKVALNTKNKKST